MNKISILDCTLRDGGYLNDWFFGENVIKSVILNLIESKIDYIECGYLKDLIKNPDRTFFSSTEDLKDLMLPNQKYTFMVNYGEYQIDKFSVCCNKNIKIRVAFKKHNQNEALNYIKKLKNLGWDVFANPMGTNTYSKEELLILIEKLNDIIPYGVSIVDTFGNMYEKDVIKIFDYIDKNLNSNIALCFHSHNSMQLSFSNTKAILKKKINRDIIIDSCVYGMGRGAGNLCTELITKYLNDNYSKNYKILPILKIYDKYLKTIYQKEPWGYSTPYYIAAIHGCHPNYARFLVEQKLPDEQIDTILKNIPQDKKIDFDKEYLLKILSHFT